MFRNFLSKTKNIVKNNIRDREDLYFKQMLGFTVLGMVGGIYEGAKETRRYADSEFIHTISTISVYGSVGTIGGVAVGWLSPIIVPAGMIFGIASLGLYGYNKINPVIPWHRKKEIEKEIEKENGFKVDI